MDTKKQNLIDTASVMLKLFHSVKPTRAQRLAFENLQEAIKEAREERDAQEQAFFEQAKEKWAEDGECELDDDAVVSLSESNLYPSGIAGAYVQAWVWIDTAEEIKEG